MTENPRPKYDRQNAILRDPDENESFANRAKAYAKDILKKIRRQFAPESQLQHQDLASMLKEKRISEGYAIWLDSSKETRALRNKARKLQKERKFAEAAETDLKALKAESLLQSKAVQDMASLLIYLEKNSKDNSALPRVDLLIQEIYPYGNALLEENPLEAVIGQEDLQFLALGFFLENFNPEEHLELYERYQIDTDMKVERRAPKRELPLFEAEREKYESGNSEYIITIQGVNGKARKMDRLLALINVALLKDRISYENLPNFEALIADYPSKFGPDSERGRFDALGNVLSNYRDRLPSELRKKYNIAPIFFAEHENDKNVQGPQSDPFTGRTSFD